MSNSLLQSYFRFTWNTLYRVLAQTDYTNLNFVFSSEPKRNNCLIQDTGVLVDQQGFVGENWDLKSSYVANKRALNRCQLKYRTPQRRVPRASLMQ
jgi:hypothetical protein